MAILAEATAGDYTAIGAAYAAVVALFGVLVWLLKQVLADRLKMGEVIASNTAATVAQTEVLKAQGETLKSHTQLLQEHGRLLDRSLNGHHSRGV